MAQATETKCDSTLTRTKRVGGLVTSTRVHRCWKAEGHVGLCHGFVPDSPSWEK